MCYSGIAFTLLRVASGHDADSRVPANSTEHVVQLPAVWALEVEVHDDNGGARVRISGSERGESLAKARGGDGILRENQEDGHQHGDRGTGRERCLR